jgi:hypothetical protein
MPARLGRAVERIVTISWKYDSTAPLSAILLMHEYLRRVGLWADALDAPEVWPFADIAGTLRPELDLPLEAWDRVQRRMKEYQFYSYYVEKVFRWHLRFQMLDPGALEQFALPGPYEPLIRMYERGHVFGTEQGLVDIDGRGGIILRGWRARNWDRPPLLELDDRTLDALDVEPG